MCVNLVFEFETTSLLYLFRWQQFLSLDIIGRFLKNIFPNMPNPTQASSFEQG
jgi:hypothetical protein